MAWAATWDTSYWWESTGEDGAYWPKEVLPGFYVSNYISLFRHFGYELCDSSAMEPDVEKIAIFADIEKFGEELVFGHVARQCPDGTWASKLGPDEDILHNSLEAFIGYYRENAKIMSRSGVKTFPPWPSAPEPPSEQSPS